MNMEVVAGWSYYLEYSTDLINWYDLYNFTATSNTASFTDTGAPYYAARFYRLVPQ